MRAKFRGTYLTAGTINAAVKETPGQRYSYREETEPPRSFCEGTIMKKIIAAIGLAIGLSFVGTGVADASTASTTDRCAEARAALARLESQAAGERNPVRKAILLRMIAGARPAVDSQCP